MIASALEKAGADKVYILGRRLEILENAIKKNSVNHLYLKVRNDRVNPCGRNVEK